MAGTAGAMHGATRQGDSVPHEMVPAAACPICFEVKDDTIKLDACNHVFCPECIADWLCTSHNTCPLCRQFVDVTQYYSIVKERSPDKRIRDIIRIIESLLEEFSFTDRANIVSQAMMRSPATLPELITAITEVHLLYCNEALTDTAS